MTQYSRPETPSPRRRGPGLASFLLIIVVVLAGLVAWDNLLGRGPALANRFATNLLPDIGAKRVQVEVPVAEPRTLNVTVDPESLEAVEVDYETAVLMDIYARGNPSVVQVNTFVDNGSNPLLGGLGQGSGFIWDEQGHIVTNAHVVQSANTMHITFQDRTVSVGEVVATDPDSDLAVLKIDPEGYDLQPVTMGRSEELQVGMRVAVIGTPFSQEQTLTSGIVSNLGRTMNTMTRYRIPDSIQFDAATNPGNSGGPLFNDRGEVVGVVSQIISEQRSFSGIGLAVPSTIVNRVIPALIESGRYEHAYLGVQGATYSPICSEALDLPKSARGAYVTQVVPGGPAARGGLAGASARTRFDSEELEFICPTGAGGDLITHVEDFKLSSFDDLMLYLERYSSPGDEVNLTVLRNGSNVRVTIKLGKRPSTSLS
ncbi:MAG: trypsin-like serine protease [Caldilineaceae bacterium SB0662_bin_9]|uniref:Trypsin-like serine protease n=1 Tax=Caldilineaceae bacterium SB0662_bin_9 TaxID=2605258 RepID=A0A6B1DX58_9CHLR|nr:trypsin-like peptidase domain-containing protein [Caldilineaceae bacterium]MXZ41470.1 trypsin-like serine protease [Caldilineaceae bacterium SB0666_bin_21]MYD91527.1 trypsin-like serine protease [Caldilineaceae bacterium SB0662_bin_9]